MLDFFNLEKQTNKRVQRFLLHKSTEENIEAKNAKLLIASKEKAILVLLLNQNTIVKPLKLKDIAAFFGKDFDESNEQAVMAYLVKLSKENQVELSKLNVVICETKGELGAHLYEETKYKKKISTLDLLTHFNPNK
ncbi:MAG: hypothetical protein A3F72_11870 [Bacteroidetes bacterium RIFCSPLOWO2_12_FULL_35_15]|nr:MAG: hypothetical protein A3F72_11870 [Bacteroidetes bacterium RIFCSPLOWO2_12_FULL_35_15]